MSQLIKTIKRKYRLPPKSMRYLMDFYKKKTNIFEELSKRQDVKNDILKALNKHVKLGEKTVLDLGAGTGRFSLEVAKRAKFVYALDISKQMLSVMSNKIRRKGIKNVKPLCASYAKIPLSSESIDIIFSVWAFPSHSTNWDSDLMEVKRVLKPGGIILLVDYFHGGEYFRIREKISSPFFTNHINNLHRWMKAHSFKASVVNTMTDFKTKKNVEQICRPFFGHHLVTYLLARNKTTIKTRVSMFSWLKKK